jgi:hypothetical protein
MAVTGTRRTTAACILALTLVLCSQFSDAGGLSASRVTRCRMQPAAMHAAGGHSCCPKHSNTPDGVQAAAWTMRAPCCNLSSAPDRPAVVYNLSSYSRFERPQAASTAEVLDSRRSAGIGWRASNGEPPGFRRLVLDVKADLRI